MHRLSDHLASLRYSNADLVGKQEQYFRLRNRDIVMCQFPEFEHRFNDLVMGLTLMGRAEESCFNNSSSPLARRAKTPTTCNVDWSRTEHESTQQTDSTSCRFATRTVVHGLSMTNCF